MVDSRFVVLAFACCAVLYAQEVRGNAAQDDESEQEVFYGTTDSAVEECRVSLELGGPQSTVDWRSRDTKRMKELFLDPLAKAKRDPMPAAYVIIGSITMTREDGSKEHFYLFTPLGHIKRARDEAYLIADLAPLYTAFKKALKDGIEEVELLERIE